MSRYFLEVCVDHPESVVEATRAGADRFELCGNLMIGGTSPSYAFFDWAKEHSDVPMNILIRPRFGDFCYTDEEFAIIKGEVDHFTKVGANGVVIGILTPEGDLNMEQMKVLVDIAKNRGKEVTLHRCIDVSRNPEKTFEQVLELGIDTILTSGAKQTAIDGMDLLDKLQAKSQAVKIMAGSGMGANEISVFLEKTSLTTFHMSGKKVVDSKMRFRNENVTMGLPLISEFEIWESDYQKIREAKELLIAAENK